MVLYLLRREAIDSFGQLKALSFELYKALTVRLYNKTTCLPTITVLQQQYGRQCYCCSCSHSSIEISIAVTKPLMNNCVF